MKAVNSCEGINGSPCPVSLQPLALNGFFFLSLNWYAHTHQVMTTVFPVGCEKELRPLSAVSPTPPRPTYHHHSISIITSSFPSYHPPLIALVPFPCSFVFVFCFFCSKQNISNIGKLYYKEGVAWMYVYMRNYMKIKKVIYKEKKTCKDNLRTLFVEIPSYNGATDGAAS